MNFDRAFELLVGHEGGYVNHADDPGGETKYGISKRQYPHLDIAGLTLSDAKEIYRRDYWDRARLEEMPYRCRFDIFDAAVNHGIGTSIRFAQRAVEVADDGHVGPVTLKAIQQMHPTRFISLFNAHRLHFFTKLSTWDSFGRGWARRVADNLILSGER